MPGSRVATSGRVATTGRVAVSSRVATSGRFLDLRSFANLACWWHAGLGVTIGTTATLTFPNDFDNAAWTKTRSSVVANATTDPFGGNNADSLVEDATAGNTHLIQQSMGSFSTGLPTTVSVYAKAGARSWIYFGDAAGGNPAAYFNVSAGTIGTTVGTITPSITNVGGGWYLCSITCLIPNGAWHLRLASADGTSSYNGDGTSNVFIYGAAVDQRRVSGWADQSGNGHDVSQATASQQPLFVASEPTLGNRSSLTWNSTLVSRLDNTTTSPIAQSSARTIFAVLRPTTTVGGSVIDFKRGNQDFLFSWTDFGDGNVYTFSDGVAVNNAVTPSSQIEAFQNRAVVLTWMDPGTGAGRVTVRVSRSGAPFGKQLLYAGANVPAETSGLGFAIGARPVHGQGFTGSIPELAAFSRLMSEGEMSAIETYMMAGSGILT